MEDGYRVLSEKPWPTMQSFMAAVKRRYFIVNRVEAVDNIDFSNMPPAIAVYPDVKLGQILMRLSPENSAKFLNAYKLEEDTLVVLKEEEASALDEMVDKP